MRNRLIELLKNAPPEYQSGVERIADYLLENDVFVFPCKVGDTVYSIEEFQHHLIPDSYPKAKVICEAVIVSIDFYSKHRFRILTRQKSFGNGEVGKKVFFSREEAKRALNGGDAE